MNPITSAVAVSSAPVAHNLSFFGLFLQADPIVKGVMLFLVAMSIVGWTIILERFVRLRRVRSEARRFETGAKDGRIATGDGDISSRIAAAGIEAWRDNDSSESRAERRERIERAMRGQLNFEIRQMQPGLPFLATTGSAAPFIGLFGTVWGIMNSFSAIAKSQDTSLAVVAPGIAEALFATAIGLVAAIPAVMGYNRLTTDLARAQQAFAGGISALGDRLARERTGHFRSEVAE